MSTTNERPISGIFPRKRGISRRPSATDLPTSTVPHETIVSVLETYLHVQEERRRLPGYFTTIGEHEKRWPALRHPVPARTQDLGPVDLPPKNKVKQIVFEPLVSCSDDLNMIYNEEYLAQLASIPKSPKISGWRRREERKKSVVIRNAPFSPIADKRINTVDFIHVRTDLANANRFLSAWNANLSAAEDERTRQVGFICLSACLSVCLFICLSVYLFVFCLSVFCLSVYLFVYLSVCFLSVCLFVFCLSVFRPSASVCLFVFCLSVFCPSVCPFVI